jgi:hypothetical protein
MARSSTDVTDLAMRLCEGLLQGCGRREALPRRALQPSWPYHGRLLISSGKGVRNAAVRVNEWRKRMAKGSIDDRVATSLAETTGAGYLSDVERMMFRAPLCDGAQCDLLNHNIDHERMHTGCVQPMLQPEKMQTGMWTC